jgi:osmoprotectant transport system permease protein
VAAVACALAASPQFASALLAGSGGKAAYAVERLLALALSHGAIALAALVPAAVLGVAAGVAVTRPWGTPLRGTVDMLVAGSQAVPPVVVVALAFPILGFGAAPTVLALLIYCVMPVLRGTVGALEAGDREAANAARAMGMTPRQVLWHVEFPLALSGIASALRVALVLAVATAAVGALAGANTLGTPIIVGLQTLNEVYILQGAAATAALAFAADGMLLLLQAALAPAAGGNGRKSSPEWSGAALPDQILASPRS